LLISELIAPHFTQYTHSIYQVTATVTTTGYGDLHTKTLHGRIVAIFTMIAGYVLFSYILGA
jgi:acyl-CoA hydrolase